MPKILPSLAVFFLFPFSALADCGWNSARTFYTCNDSVSIANSVGRTLPVLADSVRFNPASIPSVLTPAGIEATYSSRSDTDHKFQPSLLKGLPGVGFATTVWTENNFATPNVQLVLKKLYQNYLYEYETPRGMGYRLGGSFAVPFIDFAHISIGGSFGKGRVKNSESKAFGITADSGFLSLGYAQNAETLVEGLPLGVTKTISAGLTYGGLYLGYSQMKFSIAQYQQQAMNFYSARLALSRLAVYMAIKSDIDEDFNRKNYYTWNVQLGLMPSLVLGYVYGLYPKAHSLSAQLYF